jgi:hypothetical protein
MGTMECTANIGTIHTIIVIRKMYFSVCGCSVKNKKLMQIPSRPTTKATNIERFIMAKKTIMGILKTGAR